jgi:hypothetical protein
VPLVNYLEARLPTLSGRDRPGISIELLALDPNLMDQAQREQLTYAEMMVLPNVSSFVKFRIKDWLTESFTVIRSTDLCSI